MYVTTLINVASHSRKWQSNKHLQRVYPSSIFVLDKHINNHHRISESLTEGNMFR